MCLGANSWFPSDYQLRIPVLILSILGNWFRFRSGNVHVSVPSLRRAPSLVPEILAFWFLVLRLRTISIKRACFRCKSSRGCGNKALKIKFQFRFSFWEWEYLSLGTETNSRSFKPLISIPDLALRRDNLCYKMRNIVGVTWTLRQAVVRLLVIHNGTFCIQ